MMTRGVSLLRNRRFAWSAGFTGSVALSMPLGLMAGRPFNPFRRAISSAAPRQSFPGRQPCQTAQSAEPQALHGSDRRGTMAGAHPERSGPFAPEQAKDAAPPTLLPLLHW